VIGRSLLLAVAALVACGLAPSASAQDAGPAPDAGSAADTGGARDAGPAVDAGPGRDAGASDDAGASEDLPAADLLPEALRPRIEVTVTPSEGVVTGDLVTVSLSVDAAEGDEVGVPDQSFEPFEVLDHEATEEPPANGRARFRFQLQLLALEPGEHEVGPIRLRIVTADGTLGTVETDALAIEVGSVLGNEPDAQPKPPTEPVEVLEEDYTLAWVGGSLLVLILLAALMFLLARWWTRRERPPAPAPPPRPPWEIALEAFEALRRSLDPRLTSGEVVVWADELSDAARDYLGHRYEFDGLESTTDEVLSRLRTKKPTGIQVEEVAALLGDCDLVKFAKATPEKEQCEELLAAAFRIVRATTPGSFAERAPGAAAAAAPPPQSAEPPSPGSPS